jgi:predicted secreted protein
MSATHGYGTKLKLGNGASPEVFTEIPGLKGFTLPSGSADQIDVTAHDSPDTTKQYISGLIETGELGFDIFFDSSESIHEDLWDLNASGDEKNWQVLAPDTGATLFEFAAFVTNMEIEFPVEDAINATVTIKLTGTVTMTP